MDPFSITASIITIVGLADRIISACTGYLATVKDAPSDISSIRMEVASVKCVLEILKLRSDVSVIGTRLKSQGDPLEGCMQALTALDELLSVPAQRAVEGKRRRTAPSYANMAWPFKESKARKLLENIRQRKATICLVLNLEIICAPGLILNRILANPVCVGTMSSTSGLICETFATV